MGIFTKPHNTANKDLKARFAAYGLRQYQVAKICGYSPEYFSRLLSVELPESKKEAILDLLETVKG